MQAITCQVSGRFQLMTSSGEDMRKVIKRSSLRKTSRTTEDKTIAVELTASDRRILQIIATGTETEEPAGILAGASFRFTS